MTLEETYHFIVNDAGVDNSMGDYNYIAFAFMESKGLVDEFRTFLINSFISHIAHVGEVDHDYALSYGDPFERRKFKIPEFQDAYDRGVEKAEDEYNKVLRWQLESDKK